MKLMKIIAVYNVKGGVGKTTTCVNLAYLSAMEGHSTLLWDLDPQGGATYYLGQDLQKDLKLKKLVKDKKKFEQLISETPYENLKMIPAFFGLRYMDAFLDDEKKSGKRLAKILSPMQDSLEYIFIDCPPSISNLSEAVFHAADALLAPVIPSVLSMQSLQQIKEHLASEGVEGLTLLPFFSMVDKRKKLHNQVMKENAQAQGFLPQPIYYRSVIEQMGLNRAPLPCFAPKSEESAMYQSLWQAVKNKLA
jgi:cellulose biosynthesis protein BcsQ